MKVGNLDVASLGAMRDAEILETCDDALIKHGKVCSWNVPRARTANTQIKTAIFRTLMKQHA